MRPARNPDCAALGVPFEETVAGRCARYPKLEQLLLAHLETNGQWHETTAERLAAQAKGRARYEAKIAAGLERPYVQCLCTDALRPLGALCTVCGYDGYNPIRYTTGPVTKLAENYEGFLAFAEFERARESRIRDALKGVGHVTPKKRKEVAA